MKAENNFIQELEKKAKEQRKLVETQMIPDWARGIGGWLAVDPWRVLIPIACAFYIVARVVGGVQYREFVLGLFGGFAR